MGAATDAVGPMGDNWIEDQSGRCRGERKRTKTKPLGQNGKRNKDNCGFLCRMVLASADYQTLPSLTTFSSTSNSGKVEDCMENYLLTYLKVRTDEFRHGMAMITAEII